MNAHVAMVALATLSPLAAQTVSVSLFAPTPLVARAAVATTLVSQSVPAGPMAATGQLQAHSSVPFFGTADLTFDWSTLALQFPAHIACTFMQTASITAPLPASAETDPWDIVLQLQATSPVNAKIALSRILQATSGTAVPITQIDVGADGTFEMVETSATEVILPSIAIGTQPLQVLIRTQMALAIPGSITLTTQVTVTPNNDMAVVHTLTTCAGDIFQVAPSFVGTGIGLAQSPAWVSDPAVAVLGLAPQPVLLPVTNCLLLPSPDLILFLPPYQLLELPLPPALRPMRFWAQAVVLNWSGLVTTNAYDVFAW